MTIENIALDRLELSPLNVRKTRSKDRIAQMAASIEAHGILQNLRVHETGGGKFGVVIGGTRLAALHLLVKQEKIAADFPVPCDIRPSDDPTLTEVSLAENVVRDAMHPADGFDAFEQLADAGQGPETIAARFGVTPTVVRQRLKLAVVSPKLIAAYRRAEMTLEQLMAFTVSDALAIHLSRQGAPSRGRPRGGASACVLRGFHALARLRRGRVRQTIRVQSRVHASQGIDVIGAFR